MNVSLLTRDAFVLLGAMFDHRIRVASVDGSPTIFSPDRKPMEVVERGFFELLRHGLVCKWEDPAWFGLTPAGQVASFHCLRMPIPPVAETETASPSVRPTAIPPPERRCARIMPSGKRCQRWTRRRNRFCFVHLDPPERQHRKDGEARDEQPAEVDAIPDPRPRRQAKPAGMRRVEVDACRPHGIKGCPQCEELRALDEQSGRRLNAALLKARRDG